MLVWIHDRIWIEWVDSEHREALIGEPTSISLRCISIDSHDLISEDML